MQVVTDKLLTNYVRQGSGKQLLLLHGWATSLADYAEIIKELHINYDVTALDLPGFGASQTPEGDWGLEEYSKFIASFCQKVGLDDLYGLVGHSNGAAIAIKAAAGNVLNPQKLILLDASGIRTGQKGRLGAVKLVAKTAKILSLPLPSATRKKLRQKLYTTVGSDFLAANNLSSSFKKIVAEDLQADASKIQIPTLLIYGEEDDETPVAFGELYHQLIEGSTLEIVAGAGHFILRDKPKVVVKLVKEFL
jgi:pimeloyl-ACP methyl ester carboxylesterase